MKNITINGKGLEERYERSVKLKNGSIVLVKNGAGDIDKALLVVSFRDNRNQYGGDPTGNYCSLVNLDNGYFMFEERCSRETTVRRVLNHLMRLGGTPRDYIDTDIAYNRYKNYDIEVVPVGDYKIDIAI